MQDKTASYLPTHSKMTLLLTSFFFVSLKDLFGLYNNQLEMYVLDTMSLSWKSHLFGGITQVFIAYP